jgi:23S rRNA pseudouridine2605 synthase
MRLAKYLAHAGVASRRTSEEMIRDGRVAVDGEIVRSPATTVGESSAVAVDGRVLGGPEARIVYALNKPAGVVSTASDTHGRQTVVDLIGLTEKRLYPVGRLDADTTGLILLTNDGELAHVLTHPSFEVPRTYRATLAGGPIGDGALDGLRSGVELEDGRTHPAAVRRLGPAEIELVIHEGRKRQVRRMCEAVGHRVMRLERVSFGPLELGGLAPGEHRRLDDAEVAGLRAAASGSRPG